jgi:hypothetical protein
MSNIIELNLNDKLVLREQDEKGKFMIVKQGIKGNKNINENAYRLVYRLIRDFLSGKAFNSKVIYNTETKKLEYGDDLKNPDTQQRNIQIDIKPAQIKQYTQITGNYSKPILAILKLDADGKLVVNIYIPNKINTTNNPPEGLNKESIYYAKLINEIQKIEEPSLQNLFQNVEKRYKFSDDEPMYSVFEKLNDLTNKLENKHFNKLTVEYYNNENENENENENKKYEEFEYSMNKKPNHNFKYLPFTSYLDDFIRTYNNKEIEETSLGFLLDLAIRRYTEVHDEFMKAAEAKARAATSTQPEAAPAAAPAAPVAAQEPAQDKSLETLEGIKNKIEYYLDGLTSDLPTVNVNSTKQFLKNQLKINFQQFKDSFDIVQIPNISQPSKEHITELIIKYENLAKASEAAEAAEVEQKLIENLEGAVLTITDKTVLNQQELTIELNENNYTITDNTKAGNVIDKDKITQIRVIKPTTGTEPHTMYIVLNNNISVIEVQGKIQEGDAPQSEIKLTLSNPKKTTDEILNIDVNKDLNKLKTELIAAIRQIPEDENIPELKNLQTELEKGQQTYTKAKLESIKTHLYNYNKLREIAKNKPKLSNVPGDQNTSTNGDTLADGDTLAELSIKLLDFNILPYSSQSTISTTAENATKIHSKILDVMENLETNPTPNDETLTTLSTKLTTLSTKLTTLSTKLTTLSTELTTDAATDGANTTEQQKNTKVALMQYIVNLQSLIKITQENIQTKQSSQTGGKLTKQLDELNYKLHITMYIQKLIRLMVYLYVLKKDDNLSLETFGIELVLNIVIFLAINDSSSEYMICYMIDTMVSMLSVYVYLRVCKKEKYTVNKNVVLGLVLSPYYLLCM